MSRPLFSNSTVLDGGGKPVSGATFVIKLLSRGAVQEDVILPQVPQYYLYTDVNGRFPPDKTIETPESGSWKWRLITPDRLWYDAYIDQGDGSPIEVDDWITLSGTTGEEAETPSMDWLNSLKNEVAGALDGSILIVEDDRLIAANLPGFDTFAERDLVGPPGELAKIDAFGNAVASGYLPGYNIQRESIGLEETVTIPEDHQMVVYGKFTVDGLLVVDGRIILLGD